MQWHREGKWQVHCCNMRSFKIHPLTHNRIHTAHTLSYWHAIIIQEIRVLSHAVQKKKEVRIILLFPSSVNSAEVPLTKALNQLLHLLNSVVLRSSLVCGCQCVGRMTCNRSNLSFWTTAGEFTIIQCPQYSIRWFEWFSSQLELLNDHFFFFVLLLNTENNCLPRPTFRANIWFLASLKAREVLWMLDILTSCSAKVVSFFKIDW